VQENTDAIENLEPFPIKVSAVTSEGKCESEATKKRTPKDRSQTDPERLKLKTHSFMAKEFQNTEKPPLEKAKTQINIIMPRHRNKVRTYLLTAKTFRGFDLFCVVHVALYISPLPGQPSVIHCCNALGASCPGIMSRRLSSWASLFKL